MSETSSYYIFFFVYILISFLFFFQFSFCAISKIKTKLNNETKISFGSSVKYYNENESGEIFYGIAEYNPDVFIWLGEAINSYNPKRTSFPFMWEKDTDPLSIQQKYKNVQEDHPYQVLKNNTNILGIWDHTEHIQQFQDEQQQYLNFLNESATSKRRKQKEGIYASYYLGSNNRVKIILLDTTMNYNPSKYEQENLLSEAQWKWLEEQLKRNEAFVTIIASPLQILSDDKRMFSIKHWPKADRDRLLLLLKQKQTKAIFISGSIHFGEILSHPCSEDVLGYTLYEVTSSGLSHTISDSGYFASQLNKVFIPEVFNNYNQRFFEANFGTIEIQWNEKNLVDSKIFLEIKNKYTYEAVQKNLTLFDIYPKTSKQKYNNITKIPTLECYTHLHWGIRIVNGVVIRISSFDIWFVLTVLFPFIFFYSLWHVIQEIKNYMKRKLALIFSKNKVQIQKTD